MQSGFSTGNRWGLTGTEDIGNAKVGFVLESGFNSDDGTSGQGGRLFGREAQVNVSGAYGTLYAGRRVPSIPITVRSATSAMCRLSRPASALSGRSRFHRYRLWPL